jgi:hypothetical protein
MSCSNAKTVRELEERMNAANVSCVLPSVLHEEFRFGSLSQAIEHQTIQQMLIL